MKKCRKFFKKAALTAAICLAMSQVAMAGDGMPTGGTITAGGMQMQYPADAAATAFVSGSDVPSGAILSVTGNTIVDWATFNILAGNSLTVNTDAGAMLNRVTGGDISQILGTLTQTGANPMLLVNSAGIVVGNGAIINADNLVLSTLNLGMTDSDFVANGIDPYGNTSFVAENNKTAALKISGANTAIKIGNGFFAAIGKTVTVADGVTFSPPDGKNESNANILLAAADGVSASLGNAAVSSMNEGNALSFSGNAQNMYGLYAYGGSVDVSNAKVNSHYFNAIAQSAYDGATSTATLSGPVSIKESEINADYDVSVEGSTVQLDQSTLSGTQYGFTIAAAGTAQATDQYGEEKTYTATSSNTLTIQDSTIDVTTANIAGGSVSIIDGSTIKATNASIVANTAFDVGYDESYKVAKGKGTEGDIGISATSTIPATATPDGNQKVVEDTAQVNPDPVNLPTGGKLTSGNVTVNDAAWTAGDLADKSVVATKSNSIIDWEKFNIGTGKALTFNTDGGALLNRVPNGPISNIYGTLTQTGRNPMFLVNPAGILVGSTGVINANALTLSTLDMTPEQFALTATGEVSFGGDSNPGPLTIEERANITANTLYALGGTVSVADDVAFSVDKDLVLTAAKNAKAYVGDAAKNSDYTVGSESFRPFGMTATADNVLSVEASTIETKDLAFLAGGKVNITGATITSDSVDVLSASSGKTVGSTRIPDRVDYIYTAGTDNAITITGATLTGTGDLDILGGTVNVEKSTLAGSGVDIAAVGEYTAFADGDAANRPLGAGHTLTLKNTTVTDTDGSNIFMGGGKVVLDKATVTSPKGGVFIAAYNDDRNGTIVSGNTLTLKNGSDIQAGDGVILAGYSLSASDSKLSSDKIQLVAGKSGTKGKETISPFTSATMGSDNKITATNLEVAAVGTVKVFGGSVEMNGSTIAMTANAPEKDDLEIRALPGIKDGDPDFTGTTENSSAFAVKLKDTQIMLNAAGSEGDPSIDIGAGKVTLDHSTITLAAGDDNGINIYAIGGQSGEALTATKDNLIALTNGSKLDSKGQRVEMTAGQISVDGSEISANKSLFVANEKIGFKHSAEFDNDMPYGLDSKTQGNIAITGGSKIPANAIFDGIQTNTPVNPDPVNPDPQPINPQPVPANLEESRQAGEDAMNKALADSTDKASLQSNTSKVVEGITKSSDSYAGQMAQLNGVLGAINDSNLTNDEKVALQTEAIEVFVKDFEPTKQAKATTDNTVSNAVQEAGNATANQSAVAETTGISNTATDESTVSINGTDNSGSTEE